MIHKAFEIIEIVASKQANTIDSISAVSGIPRSTVHRILQILQKEQIVINRPGHGYVLTSKLLSLGMRNVSEHELLDAAMPVMRELADVTKETISLNVISGYERVCIFRIEGDQAITRNIRVGETAPLFRGSAGKVIAAGLTKKEADKILEKYVADGIFQAEELPEILHQIQIVREQGYAISTGERLKGSASMAVPVKDVMGNVAASLSIASIESRYTEENRKRYLQLLLEATRQISSNNGILS